MHAIIMKILIFGEIEQTAACDNEIRWCSQSHKLVAAQFIYQKFSQQSARYAAWNAPEFFIVCTMRLPCDETSHSISHTLSGKL